MHDKTFFDADDADGIRLLAALKDPETLSRLVRTAIDVIESSPFPHRTRDAPLECQDEYATALDDAGPWIGYMGERACITLTMFLLELAVRQWCRECNLKPCEAWDRLRAAAAPPDGK